MICKVSAILWDGDDALQAACLLLEDALNAGLSEGYGPIEEMHVEVDAAVHSGLSEPRSVAGSYKHWQTAELVRYLSFPVRLLRDQIEGVATPNLVRRLSESLRSALNFPSKRVPKAFDYIHFRRDVEACLDRLN